jgi:hypothetical protein
VIRHGRAFPRSLRIKTLINGGKHVVVTRSLEGRHGPCVFGSEVTIGWLLKKEFLLGDLVTQGDHASAVPDEGYCKHAGLKDMAGLILVAAFVDFPL